MSGTDGERPKKRHVGRWLGATLVSVAVAGITAFAVGIGSHEADNVESSPAILSYSDSRISAECGSATWVPEPAASRIVHEAQHSDWTRAAGAAAFGQDMVQVSIQGESERTVALTGIKFKVHRGTRPAGAVFREPCGGPTVGRAIEADLDTSPPKIIATSSDPEGIPGAEENGHLITRPITFPWTVSITDQLVLYVISDTSTCYCTWSAEIPWVSGDRHGTITVDNDGKGYTVVGGADLTGYSFLNGTWSTFKAEAPPPVR